MYRPIAAMNVELAVRTAAPTTSKDATERLTFNFKSKDENSDASVIALPENESYNAITKKNMSGDRTSTAHHFAAIRSM